jgi:hypothetical protein
VGGDWTCVETSKGHDIKFRCGGVVSGEAGRHELPRCHGPMSAGSQKRERTEGRDETLTSEQQIMTSKGMQPHRNCADGPGMLR